MVWPALIMEQASGKNLPDWINQRIFEPLKMNNTRMQKNAQDIVPNRAAKYSYEGNSFKLDNVQKTSPGEVIIYLRVLMTWTNGQQQLATQVRSSMLPSKCY